MSVLREIAEPFVVAPPAGVRVRTRLRVCGVDAAVLREVGGYLGSLASADLAARCAEGRLDAGQRARSRRVRKQDLTAKSSSRWAGALTRTSEDAYQLAYRNLLAERRALLARINRIEARLAVTAGQRAGPVSGYPTAAERHAKTIRVQTLRSRLADVERQLESGRVSVCRGGKNLLRKRNQLADAGLTETQWRQRWEASRLFLTADGEKAKVWGNETIRWNPGGSWLVMRLPTPLAHLANRPGGRYRLACPVAFTYRGGDVAGQAATGAVRYDIWLDPTRGRWYLDASWKRPAVAPLPLAQARHGSVVAVDLNAGHLAVAVLDPDGNQVECPVHHWASAGGLGVGDQGRAAAGAITSIRAAAREHRPAPSSPRTWTSRTPATRDSNASGAAARGRRGRAFRHQVAGIPTARFRDRLTHMAHNTGIAVIAVDPAYTFRWAAQHWLAPMRRHHPELPATARQGGDRQMRTRPSGPAACVREPARNEDAAAPQRAKSTQARPETHPKTGTQTRRPATRTDSRQPPGTKTAKPRQATAGDQATQDRSGPPTRQDTLLPGD